MQTAVASLQSPDCDTERLIGINVGCCRKKVASLQSTDCDTERLIGINVVCCRQELLLYSHRIVILSG